MAIADPITSCISLPMIAISIIIHSTRRGAFGYSIRQTSAKFRPVGKCGKLRILYSGMWTAKAQIRLYI